jgi:exodeoxyribonuclease V alpha subunit
MRPGERVQRGRRQVLSPLGTAVERLAAETGPAAESEAERWRRTLHRLGRAAAAYDLGDESVYLAEELVANAWSLGERQRLALALVALALSAAERQGSTRLPLGGGSSGPLAVLVTGLCRAAGLDADPRQILRDIARLLEPAGTAPLDSLVGRPEDGRPLVAAGGAVASHRLYRSEERLVAGLLPRIGGMREIAAVPEEAGDAGSIRLTDEQRRAVAMAASLPLAVVSGGPGTGKTAICAALCRVLIRAGVAPRAIALAAPTGKAAQRLTWSVAGSPSIEGADGLPEARTLHRLLGYHPASGRFRHHARFPIPAEVVIVDEASMIDVELMERLVRALAPATRLVLFGDADQLPSVEAGAVLRDLAACGQEAGFACRLEQSFRMDPADPDGRTILTAARAVRDGRAGELLSPALARPRPSELAYRGVERIDHAPDAAALAQLVDSWYESRLSMGGRTRELARRTYRFDGGAPVGESATDLHALAATYDRCRVLAVTRRQAGGAEALNLLFHRRAAAELGSQGGDLLPGEPVVMRENDYARGLFNGDSGVVVRVQEGAHAPELRAVFAQPDGWKVFPVAVLRPRLERAFATTVHQSQGSEHDHVAVVLPAVDIPLLSRELLYTALTRARRSVTLLGPPDVLSACIERQVRRHSGVAAGLVSR